MQNCGHTGNVVYLNFESLTGIKCFEGIIYLFIYLYCDFFVMSKAFLKSKLG